MLNEVNINYRILDCRVLLWNKFRTRTLVFVNWSRRSRITLADNLFNEIYNKTKPTTRSVRRQSKWFRTWATQCCLNCSRRTLRRSAENVYHIGVKASSVAHADISWKKLWPIEVSLIIRWTFFQSQNTSSRRRDFMVTDMGKLQKKNIILSTTWKRDVSRRMSKGSTIVSHIIIFSSQTKLDLSPKGLDTPLRNLSNFNKALFTSKQFTPRIWRTTIQVHAILEVQGTAPIIEFFFQLVAMDWILVVFPEIQKKSMKEDARKCWWWNGIVCFYRFLGYTSDELLKDNTSKDPFSQCEQLQGIHTRIRSPNMGTLTMTEMMARMRRATSTITCWTWTLPLHVNTHEYTNWRLVSVFYLFVL